MTVHHTIRVVVFGFGGGVLWFVSMIGLFAAAIGERVNAPVPALLAVFGLGSLALLYGTGEWGRWWYLLVFLVIPVSLGLFALVPIRVLHDSLLVVALVPGFCAFFTYRRVRAYYASRLVTPECKDDSPTA